mgnify:CR=1 FL=1
MAKAANITKSTEKVSLAKNSVGPDAISTVNVTAPAPTPLNATAPVPAKNVTVPALAKNVTAPAKNIIIPKIPVPVRNNTEIPSNEDIIKSLDSEDFYDVRKDWESIKREN